ncbi:hypothetical protein GCM10010121_004820 [Streptomyces brasiliensis]|uniref:Uncharacterized protein n=1 Tax=Streptomyces brasiliensis TaxID=1954 RepID=A0A917K1Q0_9ACTN|nr:hypothetical protein GCM10010121_004820 [Streptomyces brasiliensis]
MPAGLSSAKSAEVAKGRATQHSPKHCAQSPRNSGRMAVESGMPTSLLARDGSAAPGVACGTGEDRACHRFDRSNK